jgi:hypothetical protein
VNFACKASEVFRSYREEKNNDAVSVMVAVNERAGNGRIAWADVFLPELISWGKY